MSLIANNRITAFFTFFLMLLIFAWLPGTSISADKTAEERGVEKKQQQNPYADAKTSIMIIPSLNNTFGYDILIHDRLLVHQLNIPALPGNDGFKTKEQAQKVAKFVLKKIRKNEMPPTVTIEDLKKMGVLEKE